MKIYNTLSRQKELFEPITPGNINMYTCGQTVYNDIHVGNARFYVVFDAIRRYLEYKGYQVNFVQNFTDIDDKIIAKALTEGVTTQEIAAKYINHTREDLNALNVKPATVNPLATAEIPGMITMIETLIEKGFAYTVNGSVFFITNQVKDYGKLSRKNPDDLEAGARVEVNTDKRNPMDFILWKPAKEGEPYWESPWGNGRPGWHIECSVMVKKYLGMTIDIHGGATDLIFPHHENEIAQSEAANGVPFSKYWMHNGIITVGHKKMSKSLGNFQTLREAAAKFPYDVLRFFLVGGHYRMPMEYGEHLLESATSALNRIKNCRNTLKNNHKPIDLPNEAQQFRRDFEKAMDDDFNTADAVAVIFDMVKYSNTTKPEDGLATALLDEMDSLCGILGVWFEDAGQETDDETEMLLAARREARSNKNWAEADRIRDELLQRGIEVKDTREGMTWSRVNG